jgi:hypothetical protein
MSTLASRVEVLGQGVGFVVAVTATGYKVSPFFADRVFDRPIAPDGREALAFIEGLAGEGEGVCAGPPDAVPPLHAAARATSATAANRAIEAKSRRFAGADRGVAC